MCLLRETDRSSDWPLDIGYMIPTHEAAADICNRYGVDVSLPAPKNNITIILPLGCGPASIILRFTTIK